MNKKLKKCTLLILSVFTCAAIGAGVALNQVEKTAEVKADTPTVGTTYTLVTSVDDLEVGENYALVGSNGSSHKAASTTSSTNTRKATTITVSNKSFVSTSTVLNLELGGESGAWTLKTTNYLGTNGYLAAASSTGNMLVVQSTAMTFSITFNLQNIASIVFTTTFSKNRLGYSYNSGQSYFGCFSSNVGAYLYKAENPNPNVKLNKKSISSHIKSVSTDLTATASHFASTVTYDWHIKDGSATDVVSVQGSGATAIITYLKAGSTIVEVTATDGESIANAVCSVVINNQTTYWLLNDPAEVYSGMEFIFVADAGTSGVHAAGFFQDSNNYLSGVDAIFFSDGSAYPVNGNAQVFTIGGTIDEWTISGATDGLIWVNSYWDGSLYKTSTKPDMGLNASTWKIVCDVDSNVICMSTINDDNAIQYKTSEQKFAYFTSLTSQTKTHLYYKEATDPVFNWIQHNMRMGDPELKGEGTGACVSSGYYSTAKAELMKLSAQNISNFQNDVDGKYTAALARYNAWAQANGDENPFASTIDNGSSVKNMNSTNVAIIITIASILAITATTIIITYKKKKIVK